MRFFSKLNLPVISGRPTGGDNNDMVASNDGNLYYRSGGYWAPLLFDGFAKMWTRNFIPNPASSNKLLTPTLGGLTTATLTAGTCYFIPIFILVPITLTHVGMQVSTAVTSSTAELAIYRNDGTSGRPGTRLVHVTGIDTGTTGDKIIALGSSIVLEPDMYWGAVRATGGIAVRRPTNMLPLTISGTTVNISHTNTDGALNDPPTDPTGLSTIGFNLLGRWTTA